MSNSREGNQIKGTGRTCGAQSREKRTQWLDTQRAGEYEKQECQTLSPLRLRDRDYCKCIGGFTHKFENGLNLRINAYQVAAHMKQMWHMLTSQLYRAVTLKPTSISITAIKANIRVVE